MVALVNVFNRTLIELEAEPISDPNSTEKRAVLLRRAYPSVRVQVQRQHSWSCISKIVELAETGVAPKGAFSAAYDLPGDCLRVVWAIDPLSRIHWRVVGRQVLADTSGALEMEYVVNEENVELFDGLLQGCIALKLAEVVGPSIARSTQATRAGERFNELLPEGRHADAKEQGVPRDDRSDLERSRLSGTW